MQYCTKHLFFDIPSWEPIHCEGDGTWDTFGAWWDTADRRCCLPGFSVTSFPTLWINNATCNNQTPHLLRSQKNPDHFSISVFAAGKLPLQWRQWLVHANFLGVCGWVSWWWRASRLKHGLVDRERASNNNSNICQLSLNHHHQHHQHSHHHPKQSVFIDLFVYYNYMPTLVAAIPHTGNP